MTMMGVYVGNSPAALNSYEAWLGRDVDAVHGVVGGANWKDFTSSVDWMTKQLWSGIDASILWSVPLIVSDGSASLQAAAGGSYNNQYKSVAESLLASRAGDSDPIYIRTGWELNGDWFPWSAIGKEGDFIGAFRQFVDAFRGVSDRFKFEWNVNFSPNGMDPAKAYPGDAYVDVVGMDFYWTPEFQGNDPVAAFNAIAQAKYGLQWLESFADAHGKPTAYSEWGIDSNNAEGYLKLVKAWFDDHDVVYQSFWDYTMDKVKALSDGSLPSSGKAFQDIFGHDDVASPSPTPAPTPTPSPTPAPSSDSSGLAESGAATKQFWGATGGHDEITGTNGNDLLTASGGDTMTGGLGDDTYVVNSLADIVVEKAKGGVDTVTTWIDGYVLAAEVENLTLTGNGWNSATGNALGNRIAGNDSANTINGKGGNDLLTGNGGNDTFVIAKGQGNDTITDFKAGAGVGDVLKLDGFSFSNFAAFKAASAQSGSNVVVHLGDGQTLTLRGLQLSALVADDVSLVNIASGNAPAPAPTPTPTPTPTPAPAPAPAPTPAGSFPVSAAPTKQFWGATSGHDTITGTSGHDMLTASGGDTMTGGLGDDTYVVNSLADVVVEKSGGGIDTVSTWINGYVLAAEVENLTLTGNGWNSATGNGLANRIAGNDSANLIDGKGGNDRLTGLGGNDTFVIAKGQGNDIVTDFHGGAGAGDVLQLDGFSFSNFAAFKAAAAQSGADVVVQLGGSQTLTLQGLQLGTLAADDVSLVHITGGSPAAPAAPATPAAPAAPAGAALPVSGAAVQQFWGASAGRDSITGTSGNDLLTGNGGDTMTGGLGDDTYVVNSLADTVVEKAKGGIDTVSTWINGYVLAAEVENLTLTGTGWNSLTGNALGNRLTGNDSANVIDGKGGADLLIGNGGNDSFVISKGQGGDTIADFHTHNGGSNGDLLVLKGFGAGAVLSQSGNLVTVTAADGTIDHVTLTGVTQLGSSDYILS